MIISKKLKMTKLKDTLSQLPYNRLYQLNSDDIQLKKNQFSEEDLMYVMDNCSIGSRVVLETQKGLSSQFCKKYILNDKYWIFDYDSDITLSEVLIYQPHLSKSDLI